MTTLYDRFGPKKQLNEKRAIGLLQQHEFLANTLKHLEENPGHGISLFTENKDKVEAALKSTGHHWDTFLLKQVQPGDVKAKQEAIEEYKKAIEEIKKTTTGMMLTHEIEAFAQELAERKQHELRMKVLDSIAPIRKLPEEIARFEELERELIAYEKNWATLQQAKEVKEMYHFLRDKFPEELMNKFQDKMFSRAIRKELHKKKKYAEPIVRPGPLRSLVATVLTRLEQGDLNNKRFEEAKMKFIEVMGIEIELIQNELEQQGEEIADYIRAYKEELDMVDFAVDEYVETSANWRAVSIELLHIIRKKIMIGERLIAILRRPDGRTKEELLQQSRVYVQVYSGLLQEQKEAMRRIARIEKVLDPRKTIAIRKVGKALPEKQAFSAQNIDIQPKEERRAA